MVLGTRIPGAQLHTALYVEAEDRSSVSSPSARVALWSRAGSGERGRRLD